jgi:hypothetical protein
MARHAWVQVASPGNRRITVEALPAISLGHAPVWFALPRLLSGARQQTS